MRHGAQKPFGNESSIANGISISKGCLQTKVHESGAQKERVEAAVAAHAAGQGMRVVRLRPTRPHADAFYQSEDAESGDFVAGSILP